MRIQKIIGILVLILLILAFLTKVGYIPNYLGVEFLCPPNHAHLNKDNSHNQVNRHNGNNENTNITPTESEHHNVPIFTDTPPLVRKPVIYLYPQKPINVQVRLNFKGQIIESIPNYKVTHQEGWYVLAYPNGRLFNYQNGRMYKYLYWEGLPAKSVNWNLTTGFVVKGSEVNAFLRNILPVLGLNKQEIADFIEYWGPVLTKNKYNLIHFSFAKYEQLAQLQITPKPDTIIRVFMVVKPLGRPIKISSQHFNNIPQRKGFTVVEWGGTIVQ